MNIVERLAGRSTVIQQYIRQKGDLHHFMLEGEVSNRMQFNNREYIIWCMNDYLGLMNHPESILEASRVTALYGPSYPHSVRLTIGHTEDHDRLENELAAFMDQESAMLVNLGYQGFMSIIDALTDRHDTIIYDQKCHACLMDGVRLHNGPKFSFTHNSITHLETQLKRAIQRKGKLGIILVVVDGVYSMLGDIAPLHEIARLKREYGFSLFVDDSHGFGVFGDTGRGVPEHFEVMNEVDIYTSTFTKSFGNLGGFVTAKKEVIDYLRFAARSQIFSRTLPLAMVRAVAKNFEIFRKEPDRRERLWRNIHTFQFGLREMGIEIGNTQSAITPIMIESSHEIGLSIYADLKSQGIFTYIVAHPVVEKDQCLIRMVNARNHTEEDIEYTLSVFRKIKEKNRGVKFGLKSNSPFLIQKV